MSVTEAEAFFGDGDARAPAAHAILVRLADVGLGYLNLGQPLTTLSGGERQRLKLATHMAEKGGIYVLDEPTTGLHLADVEQLLGLLDRLVDSGKSVIVIAHHQAVMAHADWIIDLGPGAGHDGGQIVFEGTPADLVAAALDAHRRAPCGLRRPLIGADCARGTISQVTSRPAAAQHLRDLALLRRVRDRIDREYAQPLDVEALARGVHMSAGHLSREFRLAYGESPYSYLMTRRVERAMALLRRGDLSVTEVCFEVGCSSGTFSTRFTELVGMSPACTGARRRRKWRASRRAWRKRSRDRSGFEHAARAAYDRHGPDHPRPTCRTKTPRHRWPSTATRSASRFATTSATAACAGSRLARPASPTRRSCSIRRRDPGISDDERRTIAERWPREPSPASPSRPKTWTGLRAAAGRRCRRRPGADRPAVGHSRLRHP